MKLSALCCNTSCLQGWQCHPPKLGFTLLPCQGFSNQGNKRKTCIWRLDFKSLFLTAWCSCVLQAHLTDIGPEGGSALKNLPWEIFSPFTPFYAFLLTPRMGNFPQQQQQQKTQLKKKKNESKWLVGERKEKNMLQWVGSCAGTVCASSFHKEPGKEPRVWQMPQPVVGSIQPLPWGSKRYTGADLLWARQEQKAQCLGASRWDTWTGKGTFCRVCNLLCN